MNVYITRSSMRQKGALLITATVLLIVIMVLGLAAVMVSRDQFKVSANQQYQAVAFNEAERAVAIAERWLATGANFGSAGFLNRATATPHLYPIGFLNGSTVAKDVSKMTWDDTNSVQVDSGTRRYLIERIATNKPLMGSSNDKKNVNLYRIIARGEGPRGSLRMVQTIYSVRCFDAEAKKCSEYN